MAGSLPEMPCGPILELSGQRKRFHVPFGLKPLMDEMIRQVLRDQPEKIYDYLACFMEARVQKKEIEERKERKSSYVLSKDTLTDFLQEYRTSFEEADHCATVIQTAYRGHVAREKLKELRKSRDSGAERPSCMLKKERPSCMFKKEKPSCMIKKEGEDKIDEEELHEEEEDEEEESEMEESECYENDDENDNFAGDEYEDYSRTFGDKESEEEFETEMETISEIEELADEMEVLTVKPPASLTKYQLDQAASKTEDGLPALVPSVKKNNKDEEEEDQEEEG